MVGPSFSLDQSLMIATETFHQSADALELLSSESTL